MRYVIDGNNLAGKLGMIKEEEFDRKLIVILKDHFRGKGIAVTVVFDGHSIMGDRYSEGNLKVVYAPRDSRYRSADDMIVEIVSEQTENYRVNPFARDEIVLITDDLEIKNRLKDLADNKYFKMIKAREFADRLISQNISSDENESELRNLSDKTVKDINDELLQLWKNK